MYQRALVLGGGGSTGNAWLIGVIAGLSAGATAVADANLVIGTSAGSTAAAQLSGSSPFVLLDDIFAAPAVALPPRPGGGRGPVSDHLARTQKIIDAANTMTELRRGMGAAALERAAADPSARDRWRAIVASRLPGAHWPDRDVLITAVDAASGEPVVFDRWGPVDLVDAVAASCSSGAAYRIGDRDYIDGGYRTNAENADLAAGSARVLVLSPFGGRTLTPPSWNMNLAAQVDALRAGGSTVEVIVPDDDAERLFGVNAMDPSLRPPAARAGYAQGTRLAEGLAEFWR